MKGYESYKDSGLNWVGNIPNHWTVSSIRYNANVIGRIGYRGYTVEDIVSEGEGAISLSPSNIQNQTFDLKKRTYISFDKYEESPEIKIFEGDVLLVKTASVGKVAHVTDLKGEMATINPQLVVFKEILIDRRFFYYYLISNDFQYQINRDNYGGVVGTLTQASINSYRILIPKKEEQIAIASFLDYKTNLIDATIEKKKLLIALLKEKRQAVINEAVTKGLNPNATMKDSGVEWLGEIPEHWEVVKLKYLIERVETGKTPSTTRDDFFEEGTINWFSPGDFTSLQLNESNRKITELAVTENCLNLYPANSVLLIGIGATLGKVAITENECYANQQINAIIFNNKIEPFFGLYYLDSIKEIIRNESNASTMAILNQSKTKDLLFALPPLEEQLYISNSIKMKELDFHLTREKILEQIEKLQTYRQSLISEAVTGKIDVRDWEREKN